jgi:hypothetical protein
MNGIFPDTRDVRRTNRGGMPQNILTDLLKDTDNILILVLIFMLMKEKANQPLVIALLSVLMQ